MTRGTRIHANSAPHALPAVHKPIACTYESQKLRGMVFDWKYIYPHSHRRCATLFLISSGAFGFSRRPAPIK